MDSFPATDDPLVKALQRLLAAEGGHVVVADRIGVNDQSIYQIAYCKPHSKSGKPKSVGPKVRRGLDAAFPGWLDSPPPAITQQAPPTLEQALVVVLDQLEGLGPARWAAVRAVLDQVVTRPDLRDDALDELQHLLTARPGKRLDAA